MLSQEPFIQLKLELPIKFISPVDRKPLTSVNLWRSAYYEAYLSRRIYFQSRQLEVAT